MTVVVAFIGSLMLTPLIRRAALRLRIVDRPDRQRKLQEQAVPLCGGVAVLLSFCSAFGVWLWIDSQHGLEFQKDGRFGIALICAMMFICLLGVADDRFELRGRQKLAGQIVASGILMVGGLHIGKVEVLGVSCELGLLSIPFTMFWLLGAVNALNLLDGMDGLATSIGVVLSLTVCFMAALTGHDTEALLAAILASSLAGFLVYNFPPASIYLGDAGSMLIGLVVGALAIRGSLKGPATITLAAPVAVWAIPVLDVGMAILRRKLTGRSIYSADRGHLHHTLLRRGLNAPATLLVIAVLCTVTAVAAVSSVYMKSELVAFGAVAAVVAALVLGRLFGHQESLLLLKRVKHFLLSMVPGPHSQPSVARQSETRLQGTRQWEDLWQTLISYGERFQLSLIQLNISLPALGEDYHATWEHNVKASESQLWSTEIPLRAENILVGRLRLTGRCNNGSSCAWVGELIAGLKPFESHLLDLIDEFASETGTGVRDPGPGDRRPQPLCAEDAGPTETLRPGPQPRILEPFADP